MRIFLSALLCSFLFISGSAQTITIPTQHFFTGTYGSGSNITVPVKLDGCFAFSNRFELFLSDAAGNFSANPLKIGEYRGFFTAYVNGRIPAGTGAGNYRLKVRSTLPVTEVNTPVFTIGAQPGSNLAATFSNEQVIADSVYGSCIAEADFNAIINMNSALDGGTLLLDSLFAPKNITISGNQGTFNAIYGNYYSFQARSQNANGVWSIRTYLVLASTRNLSLQTAGTTEICFPDSKTYTVNISGNGGIVNNYPGTAYKISWGDLASDTFTHCSLIAANGVVTHNYQSSSCGRPAIVTSGTTIYNAYQVNIEAISVCPTGSFTSITTYAKVWTKPKADFNNPVYGCVNRPVSFANTSTQGSSAPGNSPTCTPNASYEWYVDGTLITITNSLATPFVHTFSTTGNHTVELIAKSTPCSDRISKIICIEPTPVPDFKMNGLDSVAGCAPVTINLTNLTNFNPCRGLQIRWTVMDSTGLNPAPTSAYTFVTGTDTSLTPSIQFTTQGKYYIRLRVINSCGTFDKLKPVRILGITDVFFTGNPKYCGTNRTINFATDVSHIPQYNASHSPGDSYQWTITGGPYSFANGTSATDRYPQVLFTALGTYNISVNYTNSCGTKSASQTITFEERVTVDAGTSPVTVCYNANSIQLNGSFTGPADSVKWTTTGTGSFSNATQATTTYTFSTADKNAGLVRLILKAFAPASSACPSVMDTVSVTIRPRLFANDGSKTICNNQSVNYQPTGNQSAATYTWTSVVVAGTVTGNTSPGIGTINDVLVNIGATDATITYFIVPSFNGCTGDTGKLTVIVKASPSLTATPDRSGICSSDSIRIQLQSNIANTVFSWTATAPPSITGYTQGNLQTTAFIRNRLFNAGLTVDTVTYVITPYSVAGTTNCPGEIKTIKIAVAPAATLANAGPDQRICNQTQASLAGNNITNGTGTWTFVGGPAAPVITNPNQPNTSITGMVSGTYTFAYVVTSPLGCPGSSDTVIIYNRPPVTPANAGNDTTICTYTNTPLTIPLNANATGNAGEAGLWTIVQNTTGFTPVIANTSQSSTTIANVRPGLVALVWKITNDANCPASSDSIIIKVYRKPVAGVLSPSTTVCRGSDVTLTVNNYTGLITKWRIKKAPLNVNTFQDTAVTATSLQLLNLQDSVAVQVIVSSEGVNDGCALYDTANIIVPVTLPLFNSINGRIDTACTGNTYTTNASPATGGGGGAPVYQWQSSTNGVNFNNIIGATQQNYSFVVNTNTWLRRIATISPCTSFSDTIEIKVQPAITNNNISADNAICINTDAPLITGSVPGGGNNIFSYQWQVSTDNGVTWANINGATGINYDPGVLTQTTKYRRNVSTSLCSGPQANASNVVTVTVRPDARALFIPTDTVGCVPFNLTPALINLQPFPAGNSDYLWFADNNPIGSGAVFPGYIMNQSNDTVIIKLKAISAYGCRNDSMERRFITQKMPEPAFTLSDTVGCGPLTVQILNTTPDAASFTYRWNFGNGQTSNLFQPGAITFAPNPNHRDTIYLVKLSAISKCDTVSVTKPVRVKAKPKALFTPDKSVGCSPFRVTFSNTSLGIGNRYEWDLGDGTVFNTNSTDTFSHLYSTGITDTFYVTLKAINECGFDTLRYALAVSPNRIRLDFAINGDEETGCVPHTVRFINNSNGASNFIWNFGDGNTLNTTRNVDTVPHTFLFSGTYIVQLHATNGCSDTVSTETVIVYPIPKAAFTANKFNACVGDSIRFINQSDSATSYLWQFGDSTLSTFTNPVHTYARPGTYTVVLWAFRNNPSGSVCGDTAIKQITIGPDGSMQYTSGFLCNDQAARFEATSASADSLLWNFGDGITLLTTQRVVYHTYANAGVYIPSVSLINTGGCRLIIRGTDTIKVDKLKAGFTAAIQRNCGHTIVNFADTSNAYFGKAGVRWDFGDATTGTGLNVSHRYNASGIYTIRQIVTGISGCSDTVIRQLNIHVNNVPVSSIQAIANGCTNTQIQFNGAIQSADSINFIHWTTSHGVTGGNNPFIVNFAQPGNYTIQLIVGTVHGCYDTTVHDIKIDPTPVVTSNADINICRGNTVQLNASGAQFYSWSPLQNLSCTNCSNPIASPQQTTQYIVKGTNQFGCAASDTTLITVIQPLNLVSSADDSICIGQSTQLLASGATIYRWFPATGLSATDIPNPVAAPTNTIRYRVVGYDGFNCFTDTAFVLVAVGRYPTVDLGPNQVLATGTQFKLTPVITNGPIGQWQWTPATDLSCNNCPAPVAYVRKEITYTVKVTTGYGCSAQDTINIKAFCENSQVFIPNAFTPDNDGLNDKLMVRASGIVMVKSFRIFNRWGELVFERSNFPPNDLAHGWDGKVNGRALDPAVFVYTAELICDNGIVYTMRGNISLIK
jgi:large repetitive protein